MASHQRGRRLQRRPVLAPRLTRLHRLAVAALQAISRIRELDITMSRAQLALERVEDILDLQQCLGGVQRCLDRGDLLGAASTIKRFKAVQKLIPVADRDRQLMQRAEAALLQVWVVPAPAALCRGARVLHDEHKDQARPPHAMVPASSRVPQTVASKFDAAVSVGDSSEVTRCCQLMSVLGNSRQGLERYGKYVNQLLDQFVTEQRRRFTSEDGRGEAGACREPARSPRGVCLPHVTWRHRCIHPVRRSEPAIRPVQQGGCAAEASRGISRQVHDGE